MKTENIPANKKKALMKLHPKFVAALIVPSLSLASSAEVFGGGGIGNGGDMLVSEFTGSARKLSAEIAKQGNPSSCVNANELLRAIDETRVFSSITVHKDGSERDAWNDPLAKTIEISRSRLVNAHDPLNYLTVVLHEYLGILGIEKTNEFHRSQGCLQQLQVTGVDLASLRYRVNPLSGTIEDFIQGRLTLSCHLDAIHPNTRLRTTYNEMRLRYSPVFESPTKKDLKKSYGWVHEIRANGQSYPISDFGPGDATYASRLNRWTVEYSVETGQTKIEMWMPSPFKFNLEGITRLADDPLQYHSGYRLKYLSGSRDMVPFLIEAVPSQSSTSPFIKGFCEIKIQATYGG